MKKVNARRSLLYDPVCRKYCMSYVFFSGRVLSARSRFRVTTLTGANTLVLSTDPDSDSSLDVVAVGSVPRRSESSLMSLLNLVAGFHCQGEENVDTRDMRRRKLSTITSRMRCRWYWHCPMLVGNVMIDIIRSWTIWDYLFLSYFMCSIHDIEIRILLDVLFTIDLPDERFLNSHVDVIWYVIIWYEMYLVHLVWDVLSTFGMRCT